ncbi:Type-1 restriction enzyme EcoKI specificity protein [Stutzerimonas stutzeri]|nr:Type-1 restriction enzyme EcoKI specificity protein [Stutzerimonas stutzeri]
MLLPPLAEQTRIAAKLDELLAQVDTLKARIDGIPALLKRFRQSVLAAAVSGRLTEEWRKGRTAADFRDVELGNLIKEGPQNGIYKPSSAYGSGVKIIRIDSFYSGEITDWGRLRSLQVDPRELEAWGVRESDILINRVNSIEHLGKCALVRSVPEPAVFESNIMRMSLKRDVVHPEYLMRFLSSEVGRLRLIAKAKHAVNQASINQGDVKACKVPLPSIDEQTEIVRRVEQLFAFADQLEARLKAAQARIDRLTQSILAKAFRGELVPQDPNDEPASALLERIKAQRAAAPKARRGRRAATPS